MPTEILTDKRAAELLQGILEQLSTIAASLNQKASGAAMGEQAMTLNQVAHHLQLDRDTVLKFAPQIGKKVGGRWRFNRSVVEQFLMPEHQQERKARRRPVRATNPHVKC